MNTIKRNFITFLAILLALPTFISAQDPTLIVRVRYITVKDGKSAEFIEAAGKKTSRFNSKKGSLRFFTWEIMDGPRQGQFVRGQAGTTWSDFHSPPAQKERDYWMKNVNPYIENQGNMETWRYNAELSYNGRGENAPPSNFARQRFTHIKPGMWGQYTELRNKIKKVHEVKKTDALFNVFSLVSGGSRDMRLNSTGFYKWADLENTGFVTMYEDVHGKGSWSEFSKLVKETMVENPWSRRAEFWRYVKEASSPPQR